MFNIAFSEICTVCVVGLSLLGPKESTIFLRNLIKSFGTIRARYEDYIAYLYKELELHEIEETVDYKTDIHQQIDMELIKPNIKPHE
jgi:Sec-independent protein translocase protein TatA